MFTDRDNEMDEKGYVPWPFALVLVGIAFMVGVWVGWVTR